MAQVTALIEVNDGTKKGYVYDKTAHSIFIDCGGNANAQISVKRSPNEKYDDNPPVYSANMTKAEIEFKEGQDNKWIALIEVNDGTKKGYVYDKIAHKIFIDCGGNANAQISVKRSPNEKYDDNPPVYSANMTKAEIEIKIAIPPDTFDKQVDKQGVLMVYPTKSGGQEFWDDDFKYKRSKHDQSNEKDIPRDTFWIDQCNIMNGEFTAYLKVDGTDDDDISWKHRSGEHGDDNEEQAKQGQCYSVGIGFSGEVHVSKETPKHPKTPNFDSKAKIVQGMPQSFGNIRNKWIGVKTIIYNIGQNVKIEQYIDNDGLKPDGSPANKWKLWFTALDDGSWKNPPQTFLAGEKHGGTNKLYIRIDHVKDKTNSKFKSAREIIPPTST
jgi:hypothetical protein